MNSVRKFRTECSAEDAPKFALWIKERGGIAVWKSVNLSNPGGSWSTPVRDVNGSVNGPPTWQCGFKPDAIVSDPAEVGVYREVLFKAFPVAVRRSGNGLMLKLTDAAQRKLEATLERCKEQHGSAHYRSGVLQGPSIGVFYTGSLVPLSEFNLEEAA
jgi:hypothetical protein